MQTSFSSPIGFIHLFEEEGHIVRIHLDDQPLETIDGETPVLAKCREQLEDYFAGKRRAFDFPMRQQGTDFQQRVWTALLDIPFGKTSSYRDLSIRLGDVKAIRAVGTANGRNELAIVVPCHRVIGSDQSLTGYAGGLHRKRWLLEHEAKYARGVQTLF